MLGGDLRCNPVLFYIPTSFLTPFSVHLERLGSIPEETLGRCLDASASVPTLAAG